MSAWLKRRRDRLLASPRAREAIARLPLGRGIADRHGLRLFALMTGFARSRMLAAAVELGLFDRLAQGAMSRDALTAAAGLPAASADALVDAMLACGLFEERGRAAIGLGIDGLVVASEPGIAAMIAHDRLLYDDLADPSALLRAPGSGRLASFWPYRGAGDPAGYSAVMAASQAFSGDQVARSYDFGRHRHVMDVGGGDGRFLRTLAARWPHLALSLADLPGVVEPVAGALADAGIAAHGCAPDAPLPGGADAVTLIRVLHDLDDEAAATMLARIARALPPGGTLIVAEPMRRSRGHDPVTAYFAAYFAAMGSGRLRTRRELVGLVRAAGLMPQRRVPAGTFLLRFIIATNRHGKLTDSGDR